MSALHDLPFDAEAMDDKHHHLSTEEAIPVRVIRDAPVQSDAAKHSSWSSWTLAGTEAPFQLLSFDAKRSRALIIVSTNVPGSIQFVRLAKQEQASVPTSGALIPSGTGAIEYKAAPNVWVIPQNPNGAVVISVLEERNSE